METKNISTRLKEWINTLSEEQMKKIIFETVEYCIDSECVNFYESNKAPYWDGNGERLDGVKETNEN